MKKMLSLGDYTLNTINEKIDVLNLELSEHLKSILSNIDHIIPKEIINRSGYGGKYKITYLDVCDKDKKVKDEISFMVSNKAIEYIAKYDNIDYDRIKGVSDSDMDRIHHRARKNDITASIYNLKSKPHTSFGRIIKKLFPGQFSEPEIETFINLYKASRSTGNFEIVHGGDIKKYFSGKFDTKSGGTLGGSCMRGDKCQEFINFYSENSYTVSMVIMRDDDNPNKIKGRAILWTLESINGDDDIYNKYLMDRIYTSNDCDVYLFIDYAKENGFYYKSVQDYSTNTEFIDGETGERGGYDFTVEIENDPGEKHYPYLDTMLYFDGERLSNEKSMVDGEDRKILREVNGYSDMGVKEFLVWEEFYKEYIDPEDETVEYCSKGDGYRVGNDWYYSEHYDCAIAEDYASTYMSEMDLHDEDDEMYYENGDYVVTHEGNKCTERYAEYNLKWSEQHQKWVEKNID